MRGVRRWPLALSSVHALGPRNSATPSCTGTSHTDVQRTEVAYDIFRNGMGSSSPRRRCVNSVFGYSLGTMDGSVLALDINGKNLSFVISPDTTRSM